MGRTRKPIVEPTERRRENPVTHEIETTVLDDVQRAYERVHQTIDGQMLKLSTEDGRKLVYRLYTLLDGMLPHT